MASPMYQHPALDISEDQGNTVCLGVSPFPWELCVHPFLNADPSSQKAGTLLSLCVLYCF